MLEKNYLLFSLALLLFAGNPMLSAQNRSFIVDTLTTVIDGNNAPFDQVLPGDTILLESGNRAFILIRNIRGDAENPVVITNTGGIARIDTDHYYGISIRNCRYFQLTGTGDINHFYGLKIERVEQGGGIGIGDGSSDFELDHISIENCKGVGISAKTDPDCSFTNTREKFTQFNSVFHDNYIASVDNEGMYIGSTKYFGQTVDCGGKDTLLLPGLLDGVRIYKNIIRYTGWDGIQVSSASTDCQVYDNMILHDSQGEYYNQMSGIIIGGGSKCDCYNNYISMGKGNGIENHGLGGYRVFNNIIVNAGKDYLPLDSSEMRHGIFVSDATVQTDSSFFILHNSIISPKSDGIRFASIHSRNSVVAANLIVDPGNFEYYENGNTSFDGSDAYIMIPDANIHISIRNNYFTRNLDGSGVAAGDYTLLPGSPLIDAAADEQLNVAFDFYRHPRPAGAAFDIGAFEFYPEYLGMETPGPTADPDVSLYPNPVKSRLTIRVGTAPGSEVAVDIYNLQGDRLKHYSQISGKTENQEIQVDVDTLPPGIYIYVLVAQNQRFTGRFIKSR